jgi:hypothetical protein
MKRLFDLLREILRVTLSLTKAVFRSWKKHWFRDLLALILLVAGVGAFSAAVGRYWRSRDVGSDSWLAWLKGAGKEYQRGAVPVTNDPMDEPVKSIQYLEQNWEPSQSMWFYAVDQGSDLLPYSFFLALDKAGTTQPFHSDENMNGYRYLTRKATVSNPDALPVGFAKDKYKGTTYLGLTCAACHTGQVNYKGVGIRIDGAPAMANMDQFLQDLRDAVCEAYDPKSASHTRFVQKVKENGGYSSEAKINEALSTSCTRLSLYEAVNHSQTQYGYARLDAFGRIFNRVLEHILTQTELQEQLDLALKDLQTSGKLTSAQVQEINRQAYPVLYGKQHDHLVERLFAILQPYGVAQGLNERLFNYPNAPVSYPFLWDIPQHDFVQWNGIAVNAALGPIGRNAGEVIGVFATLDWQEKEGISISSLIGGQGLKATHISFESSVAVHNLRRIENQLKSLESPQWPDILPAINKDQAALGKKLFEQNCIPCHANIKRDDPKRRIVAFMAGLDTGDNPIGTDRTMAENATGYRGLSGIIRNQYVNAGPGNLLMNQTAPAAALLTNATLNVVATPEDENFLIRGYQWAYQLIAAFFSNEIQPSLKQGAYTPDTSVDPYASLLAYKGRSLNGIWATAPYLHNGSVPSLYELLLPKREKNSPPTGEYRPDVFMVGSRDFDPKWVGLKSSGYNGFRFDTSLPGNSNAGHNYGTSLTPADRWALLEYLKTL